MTKALKCLVLDNIPYSINKTILLSIIFKIHGHFYNRINEDN